ncbi:MAG TPA: LysR substrate-binding domain-containing protein [Rectinemataceae bacterium]|nr:LysR substrate-binding domain-containing protein [Rectinemataceae bacterium]
MELRHLRYFSAVAEQLSFVKAAEGLHITQPPLSRQIQELEQEIGTPLFLREGKRILLTQAGESFLADVKQLLASLESAIVRTRQIGQRDVGPLRIGAVNYLIGRLVPDFLGELQKRFPDAKVEIDALPTEAQAEALRAGRLDFGFVRAWVDTEGLVYEDLGEEKLALCYPRGRYAGDNVQECLNSLEDLPFIALNPAYSPGLANKVGEILATYGKEPRSAFECNDADTLLNLVSSGVGWAVFSLGYLATDQYPLSYLLLDESIGFGLIHRPGPKGEEACAFRNIVRAKFGLPEEKIDS